MTRTVRAVGKAWALLPVKGLEEGKSRLASVLTPAERRELQCAMLGDVLASLREVEGLSGILLVSPDEKAGRFALQWGGRFLKEDGKPGLNGSIAAGSAMLRGMGTGWIIIVPCDVPLLDPRDVGRALANAEAQDAVVVVPDRAGLGTNALVYAAAAPPAFAFGHKSCRGHLNDGAEGRRILLHLASLALDIDTPADLDELVKLRSGTAASRTISALAAMKYAGRLSVTLQGAAE